NDSFGPIRYLLQTGPAERVGARGVIQPATFAQWGRWSVLSTPTVTVGDLALRLLKRYGLVCREIAQAEEVSWSELFPVLDFWETLGRVKRGYFVTGLSGIQFALVEAVERLAESTATKGDDYRMVGWTDPANPVKIFPEWPEEAELVKAGGEYLVFEGGRPVLVVSGHRKIGVKTLPELNADGFSRAMQTFLKTFRPAYPDERLDLTHINGVAVLDAPLIANLIELGFEKGYQKVTYWASRRNDISRKG
ncbi:MAG TPA: hypothetical protein VEC37_19735, partial [Bacillota bacterium]|nr:hypothetical protein [Bacillota bacterium]